MLLLLKDYYYLVPKSIYFYSFVLCSLLLVISVTYVFNYKRVVLTLKRVKARMDFLKKDIVDTEIYLKVIVFFLWIFINFSFLSGISFYKNNYSKKELSLIEHYSNFGIHGYFFENLSDFAFKKFVKNADDKVVDEKNNLARIHDDLKKIGLLKNTKNSSHIEFKNNLKTPHIIIYQLESVGEWALNQEPSPMPFFEKLKNENLSVENYFSNSCTTINAEFSSVCSFYPEKFGPISDLFAYNDYYCLPQILQEKYGYETKQFHANYPSFWNRDVLGKKWGYKENHFSPEYRLREDDESLLMDTVDRIKKSNSPTFNYVIGFTSHSPHNKEFVDMSFYENDLKIEPYDSELNNQSLELDIDEETTRNYFGFLKAVDDGIKKLFNELEKNDLIGDTVVVIYGDHRYYRSTAEDELDNFYNYNKLPFVMYVPGGYKGQLRKIASHLDVAPTLLHLIEGENYQKRFSFFGNSMFSKEHDDSVLSKCLGESYFLNQDILIKNSSVLNRTEPVAFFHEYTKFKVDDYLTIFNDLIDRSDSVLVNNQLGENATVFLIDNTDKILDINYTQATDSDRDGLSDIREKTIGTEWDNPDTDGDGYYDGLEIINHYNPNGEGRL